LIKELGPYQNPLWSGAAHRDRAKVALFANDLAAFEHHAQAMTEYFHATKNPSLIQQCDLLHAAAQAQAKTGASPRALDDAAIAFETAQARLCTLDDMDTFETEAGSSMPPAANDA
jgi:hypothetical protein